MGEKTKIEWTDATWNPLRGCSRVSEGCRHCYAELLAARFSKAGAWGHGFAEMTKHGPRWTGRVELLPSRLDLPLRWSEPRRIFVSSTSDVFHESLPDEAIDRIFTTMALAHQHTFQILTKRPERMRQYLERLTASTRELGYENWPRRLEAQMNGLVDIIGAKRVQQICETPDVNSEWPLPNVWLGVSVEDQASADARIPLLLSTPAAKRFVSYEPALGPVRFTHLYVRDECELDAVRGTEAATVQHLAVPPRKVYAPLDWIIVGGESGPGARPFDVAWARSTIAQCKAAGVACFVKQLGASPCDSNVNCSDWGEEIEFDGPPRGVDGAAAASVRLRDRKGGRVDEWPDDLRVREFPPGAST